MSRNLNNGQFKQCCGQSPIVTEIDEPYVDKEGVAHPYHVTCLTCNRFAFGKTMGDAIDKWNGGKE